MATSSPAASRARRVLRKTITFDGGSGSGAIGTVTALTVSGTVLIQAMNLHCNTTLAGASARISLGISGDTEALIPLTTATNITAGKQWNELPPATIGTPIKDVVLSNSLIFTIDTANITAGAIEIEIIFDALSADGNLT